MNITNFSDIFSSSSISFPSDFFSFVFPENGNISMFGHNFAIEDILLVVLALYLFLQDSCDIVLIVFLLLILMN